MKISLQTFEQEIDETILKRGLSYFKKGFVGEPEAISPGTIECVVNGSEDYIVRLTLQNNTITEHVCSCPYDQGPVCKHVAAVIFHLQQTELGLTVKKTSPKTKTATAKRSKTVTEQVDELLEKLSHQDLQQYVKEQCDKDVSFRRLFLANFAHLVMPDSQALYAKQVKAAFKAAADRHGFIGYRQAMDAARDVLVLLQRAHALVASHHYTTALNIAFAVLEETLEALSYADDSTGSIGGCLEEALSILTTMDALHFPDDIRLPFYDHCLKLYRSGKFAGWDWHFSIIGIAANMCQNRHEAQPILDLLKRVKPDNSGYDWNFQRAQGIELQLIRRFDGDEKANLFVEQNLVNSEFRKIAIEQAINVKNYIKALSLAQDGVRLDEKDKPGLANQWREILLRIYTLQNDAENIRQQARYLFLNSNRDKESYFEILKKQVEPDVWEQYVERLILQITQKSRYVDYNAIAQIYIWEARWADLLEIIRKSPSLSSLEMYESYLVKDYADEITTLYQTAILKYMENNVGRDHYQNACRYLRRMIKMGARDKANQVIEQLKTLYPKRKALMEELQKV